MITIVQKGHPALEQIAEAVTDEMFGSPELESVLQKMSEALRTQSDGVAIAAPQIAIPLRIFLISHKLFEDTDEDIEFINPRIIKTSKKTVLLDEGCLSVRPLYGKVERHEKASVEAYTRDGKKFRYGGDGLIAQIFQHETDHLDGILFTERAQDIREDEEYLKQISNS